jgi:hypothetical protein
MGDDALVYVNQGKLVWERDEYLASVDAVLSVDGSSLLREVKEEGDVDLSFASRLRHQLEEIQASFSDTLQTLSHAPQAFVDWLEDRRAPAQARADINPAYGFDRTVVVMKLLGDARTIVVAGVNTLSTAVVWEVVVVLGEPVPASATAPQRPSLLMSRARSFGAHAPEVVLSLPSIGAAVRINGAAACASSGSCAVWINAASGAVVDKAGWAHAAKQVTSLAGVHDSTHRQVFVAVSDGGDVRVLPSTSSALAAFERVRRSVVLHSAGSDTSRLSGFEVTAGADAAVFHTRPLWHMELAPEQHIRTVVHVDTSALPSTCRVSCVCVCACVRVVTRLRLSRLCSRAGDICGGHPWRRLPADQVPEPAPDWRSVVKLGELRRHRQHGTLARGGALCVCGVH